MKLKSILALLMLTLSLHAAIPVFSPATSNPADNSSGLAVNANLTLQFDINLKYVAAILSIRLYKSSDDSLIESYTTTTTSLAPGDGGGSATIIGNTIVVNPGANLIDTESYYLQFPDSGNPLGSNISDLTASGHRVAPITDKTTYNFTVGTPVAPAAAAAVTAAPISPFAILALLSAILGTGFFGLRGKEG